MKISLYLIVLAMLGLSSGLIFADEDGTDDSNRGMILSANINFRGRNDDIQFEERAFKFQNLTKFTLGYRFGRWEIIGAFNTGSNFNNGYHTFSDFEDGMPSENFDLGMQQLYVQYVLPKLQIAIGSFGRRSSEGTVTQDYVTAFYDGVRVTADTPLGMAIVTFSSVSEMDEPDFFNRYDSDFKFNYVELVWIGNLWEGATLEGDYQEVKHEKSGRGVFSQNFANFLDRGLKIVLETVYDSEHEAYHYSVGGSMNLTSAKNPPRVTYHFINRESEYGDSVRYDMTDLHWMGAEGETSMVGFNAPVPKMGGMARWYVQGRFCHNDGTACTNPAARFGVNFGW